MPNVRAITGDELDELLASARARSEEERELKREARERLAAKDDARREDAKLVQRLEAVRATRDRANALIAEYEAVIDEAVAQLGREHPVALLLLAARQR